MLARLSIYATMNVPQEETISNQSQDNERDEIAKETLLYHLQEMFASQIEPDVVKFTLEDCNFNGEYDVYSHST